MFNLEQKHQLNFFWYTLIGKKLHKKPFQVLKFIDFQCINKN